MAVKKAAAKSTKAPKAPKAPKGESAPDYSKSPWAAAFRRKAGERKYWLLKSEPETFSFDDLMKAPAKTTGWDGVRNYAARNFMRDAMKKGDLAFYYHSSIDPQVIVGIVEVMREGYPDPTAPTWIQVDVKAVERFGKPVTLSAMKARKELATMALIRIGRLSVTPVTNEEWGVILAMAKD
jgi:predicted RNA-binding protein with PUA-like domain